MDKLQIVIEPNIEIEHISYKIKEYFNINGPDCKAVLGLSGGKDSTIAAKLLADALGKDKVIGVIMPNGVQKDIDDAIEVAKYLGIRYRIINIKDICDNFYKALITGNDDVLINTPPRIRMAMLYAVAATERGRVINTCNYSEDYVGYSTKYGDLAGDFSPLGEYTVREVKQIGHALGLPTHFVDKIPADGLTDNSDEDRFGFTYEELDAFILEDVIPDYEVYNKIKTMHKLSAHKRTTIRIPNIEPKTRHWSDKKYDERANRRYYF